jgi:hypothetical protein
MLAHEYVTAVTGVLLLQWALSSGEWMSWVQGNKALTVKQ